MLDEFLNEKVVIDLKSPYVCLGTLIRIDEHFLELKSADLHDLRDTETSRRITWWPVFARVSSGIAKRSCYLGRTWSPSRG